jgi:putative peptidoglycan lipid II flippase
MNVRLARSAGLISVATLASRLLGVAREVVLAAIFGASSNPAMDAFNVAFRVPNLLRDLFAEGAMTAAFVPSFTRALNARGREAAWRLGNVVMNTLILATTVVVILGIIFAQPIAGVLASGDAFVKVPGKLALTVQLTRIMMPFLTTVAVAVAMMGMLNALHKFFVPAISPAMFNVATIVCALALVPVMPLIGLPKIAAIAIGTVLGGIGQIAVQWPSLRKEGFRYQPILDFRDPDLREILRLMGPGTLGLAAVQINVAVNTVLASTQPQGSVSFLQYAFRLMYLPIGLFGVSIATAALPHLSKQAADADKAAMRDTLSSGLRLMLMLNVPATIGLIALARPIVELILQRGEFQSSDSAATAAALMFYAPGLLGYSAVKIASPSFYALGDSRTPVIASVASVVLNLVLNLVLVRILGYRGLALGTAIAALFNALMLLTLLSRRIGGLHERRVLTALVKIVLASIAMGLAAYFVNAWLVTLMPGGALTRKAIRVFAAMGVAVVVLIGAARLLRIEELADAMKSVTRRLGRR